MFPAVASGSKSRMSWRGRQIESRRSTIPPSRPTASIVWSRRNSHERAAGILPAENRQNFYGEPNVSPVGRLCRQDAGSTLSSRASSRRLLPLHGCADFFFRKDRPTDHGALVRGEQDLDFAVLSLHRDGVAEVALGIVDQVAAAREGFSIIGRDGHRQRSAVVHAVVEHEQE